MTEHADKRVSIEPTEEQKLRLLLAQRDCDVNIQARGRLEAELRFLELAYQVAQAALPQAKEQLAQLEQEAKPLTLALINMGEQIKAENGWGDQVKWDPVTLTFTVSADSVPGSLPAENKGSKISIQ